MIISINSIVCCHNKTVNETIVNIKLKVNSNHIAMSCKESVRENKRPLRIHNCQLLMAVMKSEFLISLIINIGSSAFSDCLELFNKVLVFILC